MAEAIPGGKRVTLAGDKIYHTQELVRELRGINITSHVAQNNTNRRSRRSAVEKYGYSWIKSRAEYINIGFRDQGRRCLHDFEELIRRLREATFNRIERAAWGESQQKA